MLHPLLARQVKKVGVTDSSATPTTEVWNQLLERVSQSYTQNDQDRYTMERSLGLSSQEMQELHRKLEKHNAILKQILGRYVAEEVATEILLNPEEKLRLGGETRLVSVLFADIRNYTSFSKLKDARDIMQILNKIFGRLVPTIFEEHGTFDKYLGDAVMAFYGAPISYDDDVLRAVRTAVKMQQAMNALREEDSALHEIGFGVGIFTGYCVVGNLGSERLMNYTCIGDTPNSAKRLQENATKDQILICPATYEAVFDYAETRPTAPIVLKGKKAPIQAYEVLALKEASK